MLAGHEQWEGGNSSLTYARSSRLLSELVPAGANMLSAGYQRRAIREPDGETASCFVIAIFSRFLFLIFVVNLLFVKVAWHGMMLFFIV